MVPSVHMRIRAAAQPGGKEGRGVAGGGTPAFPLRNALKEKIGASHNGCVSHQVPIHWLP